MIKNIIFDFGDVFINLDKEVVFREISEQDLLTLIPVLEALNEKYEIGALSTADFIRGLQARLPLLSAERIKDIWNSMLLDFPEYRLEFLEDLAASGQYRLFLLSNTNELHIPHVIKIMGSQKFNRFKCCFEGFYLSHEIKMRKPNKAIFEYVLGTNHLMASETYFVDDSLLNIQGARELGIHTWHLKVGHEDIIQLKTKL